MPALGYLFGFRQKNEGRRELVVLLTPHIWSPEVGMPHTVNPNAGPQDPPAHSPQAQEAGDDPTGAPDPAIAPLPAGSSSGASPETGNTQVALSASAATTASARWPRSLVRPGSAPASTPAQPGGEQPKEPRRGILSSFWRRITGRGDPASPDSGRPAAAEITPNPAAALV